MWLRLPAFALALIAAGLLLASGVGVRAGLWTYPTGFLLLGGSVYVGIAGAAACLLALALPKVRAGSVLALTAALVIAAAVAYVPWQWQQRAKSLPHIHDITTDTGNPPQFVAVLPLRAGAPNPATYGGTEIAEQQRKGYPDIAPLELAMPPGTAFTRARDAAESMGWEIVAADPITGRLEATATTFWFGFKDDIVVRIVPAGGGSRIDVRSVSRVGRSDIGTNAKRIREYLLRMKSS